MSHDLSLTPTWVSDVYTPEGVDRPTHNRPTTQKPLDSAEEELHLEQIISLANRLKRSH